jgi:hypothetical protein
VNYHELRLLVIEKRGGGRIEINAGRTSERLQQAAYHGLKHCEVGFPELDSIFCIELLTVCL